MPMPSTALQLVDALVPAFTENGNRNAISRKACTHRALRRRIANEEDRTPEEGNMETSQAARICNAHPSNPGGVTGARPRAESPAEGPRPSFSRILRKNARGVNP